MFKATSLRQLSNVVTSQQARLQQFIPNCFPQVNEIAFKNAWFEIRHARVPWAVESLSKVHAFLKAKNYAEALAQTLDIANDYHAFEPHFRADYLSRAVDLFVSAQDFSSAIALTNYMIDKHIPISNRVWIALLTGDELFESAYRDQILVWLANVDEQQIDRAVRMRLCELGRLGETADRMERFYRRYILERIPDRRLSLENIATVGWVIQAYLKQGNHERTEQLLQEYRVQQKGCIHDQFNQTRGERATACFPYTAMLHSLRHARQPDFAKLINIISWMDEDGIVPDGEFFNKTIHIMRRWGWYDAILPLYQSMYQYHKYPLPTPATFRALFITVSSGNQKETRLISPRMLFKDMLAMHQSQAGIISVPYLSATTVTAALKAFTMRYDYAAIIALFQVCVVFKIALSGSQLNVFLEMLRWRVEKARKNALRGRCPKDGRLEAWISRFIGPKSIDDRLKELQVRARSMSNTQLAVLTKSIPRSQAEQLWPVMQFAYYALQAKLGYPVFWQRLDDACSVNNSPPNDELESVEDILAEDILNAFNTMVDVNQRHLFLSPDPLSNMLSPHADSSESTIEDKLFLEELQRETQRLASGHGPIVRRNITLRELDSASASSPSSATGESATDVERISWKDRVTGSIEHDYDDYTSFEDPGRPEQEKGVKDSEQREKVKILLARLQALLNH